MKKYRSQIIVGLLMLVIGFFVGRSMSEVKETVRYVKGDTIHDTIPTERLVPYEVLVPAAPLLPLVPDTFWKEGKPVYISLKVDTSAIISDYIKENKYRTELFNNDTEGSCIVEADIQYNKLKHLSYDYTPIQKETTIEKKRAIVPFVSGSYSARGGIGVGGGLFYHNLGVEAMYCTDLANKWVDVGIKYKF